MSDVSALSHEYQTSAKVAEELNEAIIAIKKSRIHNRSGLTGEQPRRVAEMLEAVHKRLVNSNSSRVEILPQEMVDRLNGRHGSQMAYFLEDLTEATRTLADESSPVSDAAIQLLDEICDVADQTASSMFRRMRRR